MIKFDGDGDGTYKWAFKYQTFGKTAVKFSIVGGSSAVIQSLLLFYNLRNQSTIHIWRPVTGSSNMPLMVTYLLPGGCEGLLKWKMRSEISGNLDILANVCMSVHETLGPSHCMHTLTVTQHIPLETGSQNMKSNFGLEKNGTAPHDPH